MSSMNDNEDCLHIGGLFVSNGSPAALTLRPEIGSIEFTDHLTLVRQLLVHCDSCLLVSPFLYREFAPLVEGLTLKAQRVELVTSCAPRGQDQFEKPFALRSFGRTFKEKLGYWPEISINQSLHSKIYIFSIAGTPFAGIVTSANLTEAGLSRNHETGVAITQAARLVELSALAMSRLNYVHLKEDQVDQLCNAVDAYQGRYGRNDEGDVDVGLENILNTYSTPSAENRDAVLSSFANYYVKVSGVKDRPILPENQRAFAEPRTELDFAKSPDKFRIGDCLLEVAVGGKCFLSYYACASAPHERTERERSSDPDFARWPYYVYANNLSLHYGAAWFEAPIYYDALIGEFKALYPATSVTTAGGDHLLGPIQMGNSYFQVTPEFGKFVRSKIDAFVPPRSIPSGQ